MRIGAGYETTRRSLCENWGWVRDYTQATMRELGLGTRLHAGHYVRIGAGYETTHRSLCENWGWVRDYTQVIMQELGLGTRLNEHILSYNCICTYCTMKTILFGRCSFQGLRKYMCMDYTALG